MEEAKGEKFTFDELLPPSVPDDENFAMAPIWVESMKATLGPKNSAQWFGNDYAENGRTNFMDRLKIQTERDDNANEPARGSWASTKITDLGPWQSYYRAAVQKNQYSITTNEFPIAAQPQSPAQDVLLALSKYDSTIAELRVAGSRPYSRFPIDYHYDNPGEILLPHLSVLKQCSKTLQLQAIAELQNGQSDKALDDIKLMFRLLDAIRTEPFLISQLVRLAMLQITLQPIYEGLANHEWSDAQLVELESELSKLDFLADYEYSVRGERTLAAGDIDFMRRTGDFSLLNNDQQPPARINRLTPAAFFYQNELNIARMHQQWTLPLVNLEARTVSPALVRKNQKIATKELHHDFWPYNIFAAMIFPVFQGSVERFVYGQSSVDLARVAIALERYHIARGQYPDSLDVLAPQFIEQIPHDVINGGPLHYRRNSDGQCILYSVGWDERDDGGKVVALKKDVGVNINQGDWVWRYPQK